MDATRWRPLLVARDDALDECSASRRNRSVPVALEQAVGDGSALELEHLEATGDRSAD